MGFVADVVQLLGVIAWPGVVGGLLAYYREPVGEILAAVARGRGAKVVVGTVSLELADAKRADEAGIARVRAVAASEPESLVTSYRADIEALIAGPPVDAVTFDLGTGAEWLTSRLFVAAAMLQRQRGVTIVAFEGAIGAHGRCYLGCCTPEDLLSALAAAWPEYEAALAGALRAAWWDRVAPAGLDAELPPTERLGPGRSLPGDAAARVLGTFLQGLQAPALVPPPPRWTTLDGGYAQERAAWVAPADLRALLGPALHAAQVEAGPELEARVALAARASRGPGIGVVDARGSLEQLVSRQVVLEQLAR